MGMHPSETKFYGLIHFIQDMIEVYGDGETDVALERAMKVIRKYCKSSSRVNSAFSTMFS